MYDPVNDEARECANIKRNIRQLSEEFANLKSRKSKAKANTSRLRRTAEAAKRDYDAIKKRVRVGKRPTGGRGRDGERDRRDGWQAAQHAAEIAEAFADSFVRDIYARVIAAQQELADAEAEDAALERRKRELERLLSQSEQAFERFGCRGTVISHRYWG